MYGGGSYHRQMGHSTLLDQKLSEFQGLTPPMFGRALPPSLIESHGELRELPDGGAAASYLGGAMHAIPDGSPPPHSAGRWARPSGCAGAARTSSS